MTSMVLPEIAGCTFGYIDENDEDLKDFMDKVFKNNIDGIYFNYPSLEKYWVTKLDISPYISKYFWLLHLLLCSYLSIPHNGFTENIGK